MPATFRQHAGCRSARSPIWISAYALSLGLVFWVGQKVMDMYRGFGIDLAQFQGNGGWFLPVPATLVVGRDGRVNARFVDPDFRHRMRTEDILDAVRQAAKG